MEHTPTLPQPDRRPATPCFASGPCAKRPGWSLAALQEAVVGRSHRSQLGKARLREVIDRSRDLLGIPESYYVGIVPASDTGAYELAMWNLLGARGTEMLAWESFGEGWVTDACKQLALEDCRVRRADYGAIPDLGATDWNRDVCFTWNGTTSGACVPDDAWIPGERGGLALCDATSAVFAMPVPFAKLDVVTWSWQKVMGGEGAHGMLALSPRAVARLQSYAPPWPLPKIFRICKGRALNEGVFRGETINTPSLLCVEDALDSLRWADSIGGLDALMARSRANLAAVADWVARTPWVDFLVADPGCRSSTSICLRVSDPWVTRLEVAEQRRFTQALASLLAEEQVAYDIQAYRDAPPGLRLWGGATIETQDMHALFPWLDWAFATVKARTPSEGSG